MRPGKRALDLLCAGVGLVLLSPVLIVISALVWLEDKGPVFYRPIRVGHNGRLFRVWKFRTMRVDADREGIGLTVGDDPRITKIGRTLRRYKLDELPQLFNVVVGEMSVVGPRPEDPRYVARYSAEQRVVLDLKPGITDPASVAFIDEAVLLGQAQDPEREYVERFMPEKIEINLAYARRATVLSDIRIAVETLARLAQGR